jgi:hypothetical protein
MLQDEQLGYSFDAPAIYNEVSTEQNIMWWYHKPRDNRQTG